MDFYGIRYSLFICQKDNFQDIFQKEKTQDQAGGKQFCMMLFKEGLRVPSAWSKLQVEGSNVLPESRTNYKGKQRFMAQ